MQLENIKLSDIDVSKTNPRTEFDQDAITELAASIKEKGLISPVTLRPGTKAGRYELVCGERRYRASVMVKTAIKDRDTIPAVIKELTDDEALELQIIENLQRKDVHPMDEAVAFKNLIVVKKLELQEVAKRVGKPANYIAQRMKLADLIPEFQKAFYKGRMNYTTAFGICKFSVEDQKELFEDNVDGETSQIQINQYTLKNQLRNLNDAPFDTKNEELIKKMGACTTCPFNTGSNTLLFPEAAVNAHCTNSACFKQKCEISYGYEIKSALEDPEVLLLSMEYGFNKKAKELQAKGHKIFGRYDISIKEKPQAPDMEEFKEQLEDGDFDSEDEMKKEYNSDLENYKTDLAEYEKCVAAGKYKKSFIVESNNALDVGKYIYVTISKNAGGKPATSKAVAEKVSEGTVTRKDIEDEIERIQSAEIRKKEIDEEKAQSLYYELLEEENKFTMNKKPLSPDELRALIIVMYEYPGFHENDEFCEAIGCEDEDHIDVYKFIVKKTPPQLETIFSIISRKVMLSQLRVLNTTPERNGKAAALIPVIRSYNPNAVKKISDTISADREKRAERIALRIGALKKKLSEFAKPAAKKEPDGKKKSS
ncbi:MAG: ParB/RepB/Spo0J family partition protein [Bacteroidia bacterium]